MGWHGRAAAGWCCGGGGGVRACVAQLASIGCIGELKWLRAVAIVVWEGALVILWFRVRYDL